MARKATKKGAAGHAVQFLTRNQAIKRLQLSLADFRRLCILKGVYPREPSKMIKGKDKTYYALKDIQFLFHEPVLEKLRQIRSHDKKIMRARGRNDPFKVQLLEKTRPSYILDHLVKERFPTFVDAVRDMDDALCMATIFANLPSTDLIDGKRTENCRRLCLEFQKHVAHTHSLRKVFLSIKGCYFQAEVMGQPITWLVPYEFSQSLPEDVDFKVMLTFLELYETQLRFINYRLYTQVGLTYPPKLKVDIDESKDINKAPRTVLPASVPSTAQGKNNNQSGSVNTGHKNAANEHLLFSGLKFFMSREVPRKLFEFVAISFGAQVGWDGEGSPFNESDERITHQIVDRDFQKRRVLSREYVQPQWLADCSNSLLILPVAPYAPGQAPPPHLSPFVNDEEEGYVPDQRKLILSLQNHAPKTSQILDDKEFDDAVGLSGAEDTFEGDEVFEGQLEAERNIGNSEAPSFEVVRGKEPKVVRSADLDTDQEKHAKLMMPKKEKRLYEKIKFGQNRKAQRVSEMQSRKAK